MPSPRTEWIDRLLSTFDTSILPCARFLELGCGSGVPATVKIAQTVGHVTATDISSTMLALAHGSLADAGISTSSSDDVGEPKISFIELDMLGLVFENSRFDGVVALYSIIHLQQDDQVTMMQRVYDWLVPGGCFLFNVTAAPSKGEVNQWLGMEGFWAGLGSERTMEVLTEIGLEVVEWEIISQKSDSDFAWIIARKPVAGAI